MGLEQVQGLKCTQCGKEHTLRETQYVCTSCGANTEVVYDYALIKQRISRASLAQDRNFSVWRYAPFYPLAGLEMIPPQQIGWTPLYPAPRLGAAIGLSRLYVKDDGRNPSASFKDRASGVALAHARENGAPLICGASTGNAASSLACLAGAIGYRTIIFVPQTAPPAKIAQIMTFGAEIVMVRGTYDQAFDLCLAASAKYGWYNRNTGYNPFTREGKKSCAFEICEQLGWQVPDWVAVSVGDGNIISGLWKGFRDLLAAGLIDRLPKMLAAQSTLSSAVADAVRRGGKLEPVRATTVADSISVDIPRDGAMAVRAVTESGGAAITVDDAVILESIKTVARGVGVFGEPAGVTGYAGVEILAKAGVIKADETVVAVVTGNGLKDVASAAKVAGTPTVIDPELAAVDRLFGGKSA
ncbi:MAG TPA: threonine synthase [bacterium]|nr:threonine synthase [bacterium]